MTLSTDVTLYTLSLGAADAITGWYGKSYATSTIQMIIIPNAAQSLALAVGLYVRLDAVGITEDAVVIGDDIKTAANVYYEVKTIREHYLADSFIYRECDLTELPWRSLT